MKLSRPLVRFPGDGFASVVTSADLDCETSFINSGLSFESDLPGGDLGMIALSNLGLPGTWARVGVRAKHSMPTLQA